MSPEIYVGIANGSKFKRPELVIDIVCAVFGVEPYQLGTKERTRPIPDARKAVFVLARKYNDSITTTALGKMLNKDHSTVVTGIKKAHELYEVDQKFRNLMNESERVIKGGFPVTDFEDNVFKKCIGFYYDKPEELSLFK